ncbi:MAG: helicase C-terminal domain-containing protein [Cyanobacteria bacterium P01_A01_bin.116]
MIETEVHQRLRAYLREQGHTQWPHHLTMARLVARALRVGKSALMQTDSLAAYQGSHRLSYLIPALLWPEPAILALPEHLLEPVVHQDIPNLQQSLPVVKPVQTGEHWPDANFRGLLVTSAQAWLSDRLTLPQHPSPANTAPNCFPAGITTLIDGAGDLERWVRAQLSVAVSASDWESLMLAYPSQRTFIRDMRVRITHQVFQHPANPYSCHLIETPEKDLLQALFERLDTYGTSHQQPLVWQQFQKRFKQPDWLAWSSLNRDLGNVVLHCGPTDIHDTLAPVWAQQPIVLMGAALDADRKATPYRDRLGLGAMTCLHFGPDRHNDLVQLYLPDRLPMPNTSHFKAAILQEIRILLGIRNGTHEAQTHPKMARRSAPHTARQAAALTATSSQGPTVIVVGDVPLKGQLAAILAAEFGSRVQVEAPFGKRLAGDALAHEARSPIDTTQGILVTGWEYWRSHQNQFETPGLLIITTLPIPSLENPLVAGRVATYKRRRQDWFKAYLLPEALSELQHAVAPVRSQQGVVALLDNRVNHRSYGVQVLAALSPAARSSSFEAAWFNAHSLHET